MGAAHLPGLQAIITSLEMIIGLDIWRSILQQEKVPRCTQQTVEWLCSQGGRQVAMDT